MLHLCSDNADNFSYLIISFLCKLAFSTCFHDGLNATRDWLILLNLNDWNPPKVPTRKIHYEIVFSEDKASKKYIGNLCFANRRAKERRGVQKEAKSDLDDIPHRGNVRKLWDGTSPHNHKLNKSHQEIIPYSLTSCGIPQQVQCALLRHW